MIKTIFYIIVCCWLICIIRYFYCHEYEKNTSKLITIDNLIDDLNPGDIVFIGGMETFLGGTFGWGSIMSWFLDTYHFHPGIISLDKEGNKVIWEYNGRRSKEDSKMAFKDSDHIYLQSLDKYLERYKRKFPLVSFQIYRCPKRNQHKFKNIKITNIIHQLSNYVYGWNLLNIFKVSDNTSSLKIHCSEFIGKVLELLECINPIENTSFEYLPNNLKSKLSLEGYQYTNKYRIN
jgi:hypothetical protein